jgi:hypothetical protein
LASWQPVLLLAQLVQNLRPDRELARSRGVEVTRGQSGHRYADKAGEPGGATRATPKRPLGGARQPSLDHREQRNADIAAIDAILRASAGRLTAGPCPDLWAQPLRGTSSGRANAGQNAFWPQIRTDPARPLAHLGDVPPSGLLAAQPTLPITCRPNS